MAKVDIVAIAEDDTVLLLMQLELKLIQLKKDQL